MPNLKNCLIKKRVFCCCYSGIVFVRLHLYVFSSNVRLPIEYGLWWCFSFLAYPPGFGRFPLPVRWHRIDIGSNSCPFWCPRDCCWTKCAIKETILESSQLWPFKNRSKTKWNRSLNIAQPRIKIHSAAEYPPKKWRPTSCHACMCVHMWHLFAFVCSSFKVVVFLTLFCSRLLIFAVLHTLSPLPALACVSLWVLIHTKFCNVRVVLRCCIVFALVHCSCAHAPFSVHVFAFVTAWNTKQRFVFEVVSTWLYGVDGALHGWSWLLALQFSYFRGILVDLCMFLPAVLVPMQWPKNLTVFDIS